MKNSSPLPFENRRRYPRIEYSLEVDWGPTPECAYKGRVTTLSVGGCFLQTAAAAPKDAVIYIRLLLAPKSESAMEGVVCGRVAYHQAGAGLGVEFMKLPPGYEEHIRDIVEFNLEGGGEV